MFTSIAQGVLACCLSCNDTNNSDDDSDTLPDLLQPRLERSPSPVVMPPLRTYGKRKITGTTKASQIFGTASSSCPQTSSAARAPLSDLTNQLANLGIEDYEHVSLANASGSENRPPRRTHAALSVQERAGGRSADHSHISSTHGSSENPNGSDYIADNTQHQIQFLSQAVNPLLDLGEDFSDSRSQTSLSPDYIALQPLTDAYRVDCNQALPVSQWDDILPPGCEIVKIAEASFAEVYRISFDGNNSILKVMQLKVPSDPSSIHSYTAVDVQQVVSEVRLMNALTEFPGFVTYKGAHLIRGKPSNALIRAHDSCLRFNPATQSSHYPHPSTLNENSLVLAIELGDAGRVLDETPLRNINEVWDVLLGVVIALATAEQNFQFEHRDLHENNICVSFGNPAASAPSTEFQRYGLSGWSITLLDYGLSRATLPNDEKVFLDLEKDMSFFQGSAGHPQFDIYRRMRTHLFKGDRSMYPRSWHNEASRKLNNGHTWQEFRPYSNVLWIKFLFGYVKNNFKDSKGNLRELAHFEVETSEMKRRLDPRTLVKNGAFSSAKEIYQYVVEQGWITAEQLAKMTEASFLSDTVDADPSQEAVKE